jgi:CTP:phosphocholine cytidylyltransferase-like protein
VEAVDEEQFELLRKEQQIYLAGNPDYREYPTEMATDGA